MYPGLRAHRSLAAHIVHSHRTAEGWLRRDLHDGELRLDSVRLAIPLEVLYANLENVP